MFILPLEPKTSYDIRCFALQLLPNSQFLKPVDIKECKMVKKNIKRVCM
jgi:hypothetical protein